VELRKERVMTTHDDDEPCISCGAPLDGNDADFCTSCSQAAHEAQPKRSKRAKMPDTQTAGSKRL
jgi:hypothetical protein